MRSTSLTFTPWRAILIRSMLMERYGCPLNPFHHQIGRAPNIPRTAAIWSAFVLQDLHVIAEEFHDQLCPCSGHKLVDAALDGLAEAESHPGDFGDSIPHLFDQSIPI